MGEDGGETPPRWAMLKGIEPGSSGTLGWGVVFALAVSALAWAGGLFIRPFASGAVEAPFTLAVALTAWYFRVRPALIALGFCVFLLGHVLHGAAVFSFAEIVESAPRLLLFIATNTALAFIIDSRSRTRLELASSEKRYQSAFDLIPFGVWIADRHGNMLSVSQSFLDAFGVTLSECQGLKWADLVVPEEREPLLRAWRQAVMKDETWDRTFHMVARNGSRHTVLSRAVPLHNQRGDIKSWAGIHLDITDREKMSEQRTRHLLEIARFNAETDQLAYIAAHDLQEPLRMIASYVQLIDKRYSGKLDKDADTFIGFAVEGANRLRTMLQNVQIYTQIGKFPQRRKTLDLTIPAEKARANMSSLLAQEHASLTIEQLPECYGDEVELTMLFEHLIDNAVKFRSRGVTPEIKISASSNRGLCTIAVRDNGIGIEEAYRERIFDLFQRLNPRDEYEGTGLGLAVAKKIVETHGGRIWVESNSGNGSTFYFQLPSLASQANAPIG